MSEERKRLQITKKEERDSIILSTLNANKGLPRLHGKKGLGSCQGYVKLTNAKIFNCWNKARYIVASPAKGTAVLCCQKCSKVWYDQFGEKVQIYEINIVEKDKDFEYYLTEIKFN